jgi:hypothetical protein
MIGRRSAVALSLFSALLFSAFAAQGASALGTTVETCQKQAAGVASTFEDEHCDKPLSSTGKWKHVPIAANPGEKTDIAVTNEKTRNNTVDSTDAVLEIKNFHGIAVVTITCKKVKEGPTTSYLENKAGPPMQAEGTVDLTYTECTTNVKECAISSNGLKTPGTITAAALGKTIEPSAATMGVEFSADGTHFAELEWINNPTKCALAAFNPTPVDGSVVATPGGTANGAGATLVVSAATSKLTVGGVAATLSQTTTARMSGAGGEPLILTTEPYELICLSRSADTDEEGTGPNQSGSAQCCMEESVLCKVAEDAVTHCGTALIPNFRFLIPEPLDGSSVL